jgi:hypothetical protein
MDCTRISDELKNQHVAVTGRLASMSRPDFIALVERHGGQESPSVCKRTTLVVVGREGWPLRSDGQPSHKLRRAHEFKKSGQPLEIVTEEEFLRRLQIPELAGEICQPCTMSELTRILSVPRSRVEMWQRFGLLTPSVSSSGIPIFDFRQVLAARSLIKLLNAGVTPRRLMRSLCLLRTWLPDDNGLSRLAAPLTETSGEILFRTDAGQLVEANGQLLIDYEIDNSPSSVVMTTGCDSDQLFEKAVQFDEAGEHAESARCYRQLLSQVGPDADVCFNLANALHSLGEIGAAVERLYEAVAIDRDHVDAWNNLGHFLAEAGRLRESAEAYRNAVAIEPEYPDAHYGLADVLERLGRHNEARSHWRVFLQHEPVGSYADYARQRLAQLA